MVGNLRADVLLSCTYIDPHVPAIRPARRLCELTNGQKEPIIRRYARKPIKEELDESKFVRKFSTTTFNAIRIAKRTEISANSETWIPVNIHTRDLRITEGRQEYQDKKRIAVPAVVARIQAFEQFWIKFANFSNEDDILQPRERIATSLQIPILTKDETINSVSSEALVRERLLDPKTLAQPFRDIWDNTSEITFEVEDEPAADVVQPDPEKYSALEK